MWIHSFFSEAFPIDVPARAEEITIPAELTPEKVTTFLNYVIYFAFAKLLWFSAISI